MEQPHFAPPFQSIGTDPFATTDARGTTRCRVRTRAHLRNRALRFDIDLVELSPTGFRAETAVALTPGSPMWLTLPGLAPLEAVVVWRDPTRYGCEFAHPLDAAVFDHLVGFGMG